MRDQTQYTLTNKTKNIYTNIKILQEIYYCGCACAVKQAKKWRILVHTHLLCGLDT